MYRTERASCWVARIDGQRCRLHRSGRSFGPAVLPASRVQQLVYRTGRLLDPRIGVGSPTGVGIGDGNPAKLCAPDDVRAPLLGNIGIEKRVVFRRIAVRP